MKFPQMDQEKKAGFTGEEIEKIIRDSLKPFKGHLKKVLLLPPDYTRSFSGVGEITAIYYRLLRECCCQVDVMPALGTHKAMTDWEIDEMFLGEIPPQQILVHHWREDVVRVGCVPEEYMRQLSGNFIKEPLEVKINFRLLDPSYDLILSIGQVVPHEVVGMANYSKNIFVGCGGSEIISKSHILGAIHGVERIMGQDQTPPRRMFDYAEEHFINHLPLLYVLTVSDLAEGKNCIRGIFIGRERTVFEKAVKLSQKKNIFYVEKPVPKIVAYMDGEKYKTTWVANKAIYRSRMALADQGELIVIAPGVKCFGEDPQIDKLLRKYGYMSSEKVLELCSGNTDLAKNLSAAAHMLQSTPDGRFTVTYATGGLSQQEVEKAGFRYMPLGEALRKYAPMEKTTGTYQAEDGEVYLLNRHPASGLWTTKNNLQG